MASLIGSVDNTGDLAHINMLKEIRDFAVLSGWTLLRDLDAAVDVGGFFSQTIILKGSGYSGTEEIFIGFATYENSGTDYYNISMMVARGFVAGNTWGTQPGISPVNSICAHNLNIGFWLDVTPQRIAGCLKVGTPVYESFYVGKFFPYAQPSQYPQPLCIAGTLTGSPVTRYSDTSTGHSFGVRGNSTRMRIFLLDGSWSQVFAFPYYVGFTIPMGDLDESSLTRPAGDSTPNYVYSLNPIELWTSSPSNIYGRLEGVFQITGFDNVVENTVTIEGRQHIIVQDVFRTGFADYFALELTEVEST